jgi:tRNA G18 (ribose-2'-O)-methylase SpoU
VAESGKRLAESGKRLAESGKRLAESGDMALILGEERYGIPDDVLAQCDGVIEIPMVGRKESFNVSVAAGIALWEITRARRGAGGA